MAAWPNLLAAYQAAARGKRGKAEVAAWEFRLGERLHDLSARLRSQVWRPGPYRHFALHEGKRRWISAAPFEDRIVHHALVRCIEPRFEALFLPGSYANRVGRGTHRAVLRLQVHEGSAQVQLCAAGVPWLGFVVYPQHIRVKGRKVVEATRRLRHWHAQWQDGHIPFAELDARVQGWIAHVAQADSWGLRAHVLGQLPLQAGLAAGFGRLDE